MSNRQNKRRLFLTIVKTGQHQNNILQWRV
jgi:hypothetical protein